MLLGPLSDTELRQAIVTPAQDAGVVIEPGLPERLIADLGRARRAAATTRRRCPGSRTRCARPGATATAPALTLAGYRRAGGVDGAVARTAEQVYSELDEAGRDAAREPAAAAGDRARRAPGACAGGPSPRELVAVAAAPGVLDRLVAARLVTVDGDGARIGHEALLTAWPRLRDWIEADRAGLVQHRG